MSGIVEWFSAACQGLSILTRERGTGARLHARRLSPGATVLSSNRIHAREVRDAGTTRGQKCPVSRQQVPPGGGKHRNVPFGTGQIGPLPLPLPPLFTIVPLLATRTPIVPPRSVFRAPRRERTRQIMRVMRSKGETSMVAAPFAMSGHHDLEPLVPRTKAAAINGFVSMKAVVSGIRRCHASPEKQTVGLRGESPVPGALSPAPHGVGQWSICIADSVLRQAEDSQIRHWAGADESAPARIDVINSHTASRVREFRPITQCKERTAQRSSLHRRKG